jgi:hypothetical protein
LNNLLLLDSILPDSMNLCQRQTIMQSGYTS